MKSLFVYGEILLRRFFLPLLCVLAVVGILEMIGVHYGLFLRTDLGYDKLLHFLGGSACGIAGVWFFTWYPWDIYADPKTHRRRIWLGAIVSAFTIGVGWEILQMYFPWMRDASDYLQGDGVMDVVFDTLGGIAAALGYHERK